MKKGLKRALRVGGIALGGLVALLVIAVLLVLFDKPLVRSISQKYIARKAGLPIQIGKLDYTLFPLHATLTSVTATYKAPIYTARVSADRIEVRGDLRKLLNGTKPALESVEVNVSELSFDQTEISPEPVDFRGIILQTSGILSYTRQASITCGRMTLAIPGQAFVFDKAVLGVSRTGAENAYNLHLASDKATAGTTDGRWSLESGLNIDGSLTLAETAAANLRVAFASPRVTAAGRKETLGSLSLGLDGTWDMGRNRVLFPDLSLVVPDLITASVSGSADLAKPISLAAAGDIRLENLESLSTLLGPSLPPGLRATHLRGRSRVRGEYTIPPSSSDMPPALDAAVELDHVGLEYAKTGLSLKIELTGNLKAAGSLSPGASGPAGLSGAALKAELGIDRMTVHYEGSGRPPLALELSGRLDASGTFPDLEGSIDIRSSVGAISQGGLSVGGTALHVQASGTKSATNVSRIDATLSRVSAALPGGRNLAFDKIELSGAVSADISRRTVNFSGLEARIPALSPLRLSGRFDMAPRGVKQARLESRDLKLPALRALLRPFLPPALADWEADGSAGIVLDAKNRFGPAPGWDISADFSLSETKFNDASFTIAGDSLSPRLRLHGSYDTAGRGAAVTATLEISQGESLWKDFYISWSKHPLKADLSGRYDPVSGKIDGLSAAFVFPTIGELRAEGALRLSPSPSFDLRAKARLGLAPVYSLYSQAGAPETTRLRLTGDLAADLALKKDQGGATIDGRVTVDASDIENPAAKLAVSGLRAELPVHLALGEARPGSGSGESVDQGTLRIREIRTPSVAVQPPALTLTSRPNDYRVEAFALELFGARLEFGEIGLGLDPAARAFHGTASLRLPDLDLSRLPAASPRFPLTGHARADFPAIEIAPDRIATQGRAELDVFEGRVIVRDLAVANPFAAGRAISCDVDLLNLNLKKVTDLVPFGEVTGVISGEVQGLTISYGQPESFVLTLQSVPRKGVAQTFSLKAVDNLTVLSSGQSASAGTGGFWMKFIRGFRYKKIGIRSTLRNDTFTLNGTIHQGGVEYLVKKPALFGINVINRMPDKKISFKEMMSRLERVGQSEGPTVNK